MALPKVINSDGIRKHTSVTFGGYDHNEAAQDGAIWDMGNMTSDYYPILGSRLPRILAAELVEPYAVYGHDGLYWVDGDGFYADGVRKGTVAKGEKRIAVLGASVVVFPDKMYYNTITGEFASLTSSVKLTASFENGTYAGEEAELNTISGSVVWDSYFKVGDAVTITGAKNADNNKTAVIREIDGGKLRFYEHAFVQESGSSITVSRDVPDLDFICSNENRLWGCKGDTIYASKLGDATNWNVFDGISTDSYAVDVGSAGDFTACTSFLGYPVFFKEEAVYKVYGSKPSNFQVMGSATLGVEKGSHGSLAVAGETLFYLSRAGVMAYSGGIPQNIHRAFGLDRYHNAVGGSDGTKYYVSMERDGEHTLFVYDTRYNVWHKEDYSEAVGFAWNGDLHMLTAQGKIVKIGNVRDGGEGQKEAYPDSFVEFADFVEGDPNRKGTAKIQLRGETDEGCTLTVEMQFDSDGVWREVAKISSPVKRSFYLPIIPRRSDHFKIRISGSDGAWRLYSLVRENYSGSEL